ncbi:MAG: 2-oxo acid dehydrogenase subunit E2, partial [Actinomycetes bacterium]
MEEAISAVSQTPASSAHTEPDPAAVFGANEWLVEELYQRYRQDRNSVDPAWWDFFEDFGPESRSAGAADAGDGGTAAAVTPASQRGEDVSTGGGTASEQRQAAAPETNAQPSGQPSAGAPSPSPAPAGGTQTLPPAPEPEPEPPAPAPRHDGVQRTEPGPLPADLPKPPPALAARQKEEEPQGEDETVRLKGPAARVVTNMEASLDVPTATSVRAIPAKLLVDNRIVINSNLKRARGGKVSFTHLIGFAMVQALKQMPEMNYGFTEIDGKPSVHHPAHINPGIAIDLVKADGTRQLLVPAIKNCEEMDFAQFWAAYEDVVRRARAGKLAVEDFAGTTISLTNPGTIGTVHSVPRLMKGQGAIVGVGAMDYPAEYQGASEETLARLGVSKVLTLTSTYDHRIIQGAQSGDFLRIIHALLLGEEDFYDRIFRSLRIPYE